MARSAPTTPPDSAAAGSARSVARALVSAAYLPTFLAEIGVGAILPVLTLSVLDLDYSAAVAASAVGAYSAGRMAGSGLGGVAAHRAGPAAAGVLSLAALAAGAVVCALVPGIALFLVGAAIIGLGHAAFHVARQEQINSLVPVALRARALTTLAGVFRVANFIGPVVASALLVAAGHSATYVFAAACIVAGMVALRAAPAWRLSAPVPAHESATIVAVVRDNASILRTLGVAIVATGALRAARVAVIPLWATHIGLSPQVATLIYGVSAAVDMMLFYPAGYVMDRWGRRWTALPSTALLAVGMIMLPLSHGVATVTIAAVILGIGNGWGSGLVMTLGADVAPRVGRSMFTGVWMTLQDGGGLAGPAIISAGAIVSLALGVSVIGVVGFATLGAFAAWIPPRVAVRPPR